jgi:ATP/maltotriose-dependent transcriptional regulator MalT
MTAALDELVQHYTEAAAYEAALGHARRRLALDPLHEPAHQTLMRLYAFSGRQAAALRQFDACRRVLQTELGLEPDAETLALATAIREKRLTPAPQPEQTTPIARPQPPPVTSDDEPLLSPLIERPLFVGREPELAQLNDALTKVLAGQGRLRIITGEAGAGKSALVTEFSHRIAASQADLWVTVGSCDAQTGSLDPYLPFREALTLLLRGEETGAARLARPNLSPTQARQRQAIASRALLE